MKKMLLLAITVFQSVCLLAQEEYLHILSGYGLMPDKWVARIMAILIFLLFFRSVLYIDLTDSIVPSMFLFYCFVV